MLCFTQIFFMLCSPQSCWCCVLPQSCWSCVLPQYCWCCVSPKSCRCLGTMPYPLLSCLLLHKHLWQFLILTHPICRSSEYKYVQSCLDWLGYRVSSDFNLQVMELESFCVDLVSTVREEGGLKSYIALEGGTPNRVEWNVYNVHYSASGLIKEKKGLT